MNKEDKDAVYEMEKIAELGPEELANTAGGREIRRSEWDKLFQIKARLNYTMSYLYSNGKNEEISNLATPTMKLFPDGKRISPIRRKTAPILISENTSVFNGLLIQ